jgi:hypothetical protein
LGIGTNNNEKGIINFKINHIMALTTPKDLTKPEPQVDAIIKQIEAEFKKKPKIRISGRGELMSAYYIITVRGFYRPEDINAVVEKYTEAGWKQVWVDRAYVEKGQPAQLTKFKFFEVY